MDIQNIIRGENRKKFLIIALVVFLILFVAAIFFILSSSSSSQPTNDQVLSGITSLTPPDQAAKITASKQAPIITLSVDHAAIAPGQSAKIAWDTKNTTNCVNGDGDPLDLMGSISVSPKSPLTFDILCSGPNGTDLQSISVDVTGAPIITLYSSPKAVIAGEKSVISWSTTNADRCVDGTGKTIRLSDSFTVSPRDTYIFTMSCTGSNGTSKKSVTVAIATPTAVYTGTGGTGGTGTTYTVPTSGDSSSSLAASASTEPSIVLSASPSSIDYNAATTIMWGLKNVTYCVFTSDDVLGGLPPFTYSTGSRLLSSMASTTTYTLSCSKGSSKISKSVTVTVAPKPAAEDPNFSSPFTATPVAAATYAPIKFTWSAKNAKVCGLKKDGVDIPNKTNFGAVGNATVYEGTPNVNGYVYTLVCKNADGVEITSQPQTIPVVNCQFPNGFGDKPDDPATGQVVLGSRYGLTEKAICTYTYGKSDGKASDFAKIWNLFGWGNGAQLLQPAATQLLAGNNFLCSFTRYTSRKNAGGGAVFGDWENNFVQHETNGDPDHGGYHRNWKFLSYTAETNASTKKDIGMNSMVCQAIGNDVSVPHIGEDSIPSYSGGNMCDGSLPPVDTCDGRLSNDMYKSCGPTQNMGPCIDVANFHYSGGSGYCHYPYNITVKTLTCKP